MQDYRYAKYAQPVYQNDLDNFHAKYGFKLSPQLDEAQRYEILEKLHHYKSVFACDMTEINMCQGELLKLRVAH